MLARFKYVYLLAVLALVVLFQLYSPNRMSEAEIRVAADGMAENVLLAMAEGDYSRFSKEFDEKMKSGMSEAEYRRMIPVIRQALGQYGEKSFMSVEENGAYWTVAYRAKFSKEPDDVIVRLIVSEREGRLFISGFWLDSPLLRSLGDIK